MCLSWALTTWQWLPELFETNHLTHEESYNVNRNKWIDSSCFFARHSNDIPDKIQQFQSIQTKNALDISENFSHSPIFPSHCTHESYHQRCLLLFCVTSPNIIRHNGTDNCDLCIKIHLLCPSLVSVPWTSIRFHDALFIELINNFQLWSSFQLSRLSRTLNLLGLVRM